MNNYKKRYFSVYLVILFLGLCLSGIVELKFNLEALNTMLGNGLVAFGVSGILQYILNGFLHKEV